MQFGLSKRTVGIFLLPGAPVVDVLLMVDCFNKANSTRGEFCYTITSIDRTKTDTFADLGVENRLTEAPASSVGFDYVVVFAGDLTGGKLSPPDKKWLLYQARTKTVLGAVGYGVVPLVELGLLTTTPVSVHWSDELSFRESYPAVTVTGDLFIHTGRRFTCCGGIATLDAALYFVALDCGDYLASYVADMFVYNHSRNTNRPQRASSDYHLAINDERLLKAVKLMQQNLEDPLDVNEIADRIGVGIRNLQRLFKRHLETAPVTYYKNLRLWNARRLLLDSSIRISEIALACGFMSSSHFTTCYKEFFSVTPSRERRRRSAFHTVHPKHRESMRMSKNLSDQLGVGEAENA